MKKLFYSLLFLITASFTANAQSKIMQLKQKYNFMQQLQQHQNLESSTQKFGLKINPYWQDIDAPHTYNSFIPQIKVPCYGAVWARVNYDSVLFDANSIAHTKDNGKTWQLDSVTVPQGYALGSISAIDGNVCYASIYHASDGVGGGVYRTTDGATSWEKIGVGQLFADSNFIDFVYFFDANNGIVVGDNDKIDSTHLEIYTTADAGKTWSRVPAENIPPTANAAESFPFNSYTAYKSSLWVKAVDSQGNLYLYRSDDLGKHWQLFPFNVPEFGFDFAFADKQNGIAVGFPFDGNQSFEAVTNDGGETWIQKTDFTGYVMGGFLTVIPGTHTYVSTLPGYTPVYGSSYSRDGGNSWKLIDTGLNAHHSAVAFLNPFNGWTGRAEIDDPNGGAFKWKYHISLDDKAVAITNENNLTAVKINSGNPTISIYPNPAKNIIKVDGLDASLKTTLSLYNISGRLIEQAVTTNSSYAINLQKIPAGNYYIIIQTDKNLTTLKFIKE